jgi:hypothetical protein
MATMTADNMISDISQTLIAPTQTNATGLVAPLLRATGHLLYALAASSSTPPTMTPEEERDEIAAAALHLNATFTAPDECLTVNIKDFQSSLVRNVNSAVAGWTNWSAEDHPRVLMALINECLSFGCRLDRELAGIRNSDSNPGSAL